uniref:Uncharacterized protein n=1 Tax=Rhizophora mucronata TaxID=61149 RepID=A0A2P2N012_RHIMU
MMAILLKYQLLSSWFLQALTCWMVYVELQRCIPGLVISIKQKFLQ